MHDESKFKLAERIPKIVQLTCVLLLGEAHKTYCLRESFKTDQITVLVVQRVSRGEW